MPEEAFLAVHVGLASLATTRWLCSCPRQVRMARVDSVVGFESMGYGPFVSVDFWCATLDDHFRGLSKEGGHVFGQADAFLA